MSLDAVSLDELCGMAVAANASDLHLTVGLPPTVRIDGRLHTLPFNKLEPIDTQRIIYDILTDHQIERFEREHELDLSYGIRGLGRFRVNVYMQRSSVAAALRAIPTRIPTLEELNLPPVILEITSRHSGLILVTGQTGSGKSTTQACMVDHINRTRSCHILTIEDPIEYLHSHGLSMINQREIGTDALSFASALRSALREDPDVVLVGELRDLETVEAAMTVAETGHLVLGTLHTRSAPQTVDRIIDVFPPHQQEQIRVVLSNCLEAVITQQLLPRASGSGRVPALEIMIVTSAIRNLIREGKTHQMPSVIETGLAYGMQTMDGSLADLVRRGIVTHEEAASRALDPENFQRLLMAYYEQPRRMQFPRT
ncbi:MAG: type IV pilus twitching motility protein PilT [Candidatus Zipacnadales bacterium]